MLGNGRVEAMCFDGEKRLAHIRGKMRKKVSTRPVRGAAHGVDHRGAVDMQSGPRKPSGEFLEESGSDAGAEAD